MNKIETDEYRFISIIYSLVSHNDLQESARKRWLQVWISVLFGKKRVSNIRLDENFYEMKSFLANFGHFLRYLCKQSAENLICSRN